MQFNINWENILHLTHDYCYNKKKKHDVLKTLSSLVLCF